MNRRDLIPLTFLLLALATIIGGCATAGFGEHGTWGVTVDDPKEISEDAGRTYSGALRPTYSPEVREKCAAWGFPDYLWCLEIEQARFDEERANATRQRG